MRSSTTLVTAVLSLALAPAAFADDPPTVAEPARPQYGYIETSTPVSVLGADDGGESLLTYTWSSQGGPAPVSFTPNGTNAAKNSDATFAAAGNYQLLVTIRDGSGQTVVSSIGVYVTPRMTSARIEPANAVLAAGGSQQLVARGYDQFGGLIGSSDEGLGTSWYPSSGGTINDSGVLRSDSVAGGPHTIRIFVDGGIEAHTTFTLVNTRTAVGIAPVADAYVRDGSYANSNFGTAATLVAKSTTAVGNNRVSYLRFPLTGATSSLVGARLRVYGSRSAATALTDTAYAVTNEAWSESTVNWNNRPSLDARQGASVTVTPTARYHEWDVSDFVRARKAAGAAMATVAVAMDQTTNDAPDTFNSREASGNRPELRILVADEAAPTVAVPAAASPAIVTGTTTQLSVRGADDQGEAALTYTWSAVGQVPAPVTFSSSGTNAAKNTVATFSTIGEYALRVVIRDASGRTIGSTVHVVVPQTVTTMQIRPEGVLVPVGGRVNYDAYGFDQFGVEVDYGHDGPLEQVFFTVSGGGTMIDSGIFTAGNTAGGPHTVTAQWEGITDTTTVTVAATTRRVLSPVADTYVRDGAFADTNFGTQSHLFVKTTDTVGQNHISYLMFPITTVGQRVVSATLRLHGYRTTAHQIPDAAYGVNSNGWSETAITWNNRPPLAPNYDSAVVVGTGFQFREWDVTRWVTARKAAGAPTATLAVKMEWPVELPVDDFTSRESVATANRPQLVVVFMQEPPAATVTLDASADAYVRDGASAGSNYGTATVLNVKKTATSGNNRRSYLRFPLTNVGADVTQATLRVYGSRPAYSADIWTAANAVSSNSWSETGINWNNKPAMGARQGNVVSLVSTPQYYEFDVTAFVRSQRAAGVASASFALEMGMATDAGPDVFNSREAAANPPQLVVTSRP
jgi:hypothetical protein